MSVEAVDGPGGALHADEDSLAAAVAAAGGAHAALIANGTVDGWYARLEAVGADAPRSRYLVSVDDTVRGAAARTSAGSEGSRGSDRPETPESPTTPAPAGRAVGGGVVLSAVERPVADPAGFLAAVLDESGVAEEGGSVVIDDPGALLPDDADVGAVVGDLVAVAAEAGAELHVAVAGDGAALSALSRRLPGADDEADRALAARLLPYLRETDPTNFGYLRRNWREARRGLAAVGMTYPQSKQVHAAIPDPETTPRTLGATLQALVTLGALGVWGDTVAANRYDLTGYDPARVDAVGDALEALDDPDDPDDLDD